jgi:gamma-butyrobetaine dioxygenase
MGFTLYTISGVAVVYMYFQVPLMVLIILPALEGLRPSWREAAENLGTRSWQRAGRAGERRQGPVRRNGRHHRDHHGAVWLASWFGPQVTEPVRLHIAAKRYLCANDPAYYGLLSEASRYTLAVQGGPMTAPQARAFEALPAHRDAISVRRWDDQAKDPAARVPGLDHYRPLLAALAGERARAAGTGEASGAA